MLYYVASLRYALILCVSNYEGMLYKEKEVRSLPEVWKDYKNSKKLFKRCGFKVTAMWQPTGKQI